MRISARQLNMAMGAERMSAPQLRDLLQQRGVTVREETIGRIRAGTSPGRAKTMNTIRELFEELGYKFSATNGHVCVCAPDDE